LLERCLEKDLGRRLGDITEAVQEITETLSTPPQSLLVRLRRMAFTVIVTVTIVLSGVAVWFALTNEPLFNSKQKRLVVVPFENLGPADDEYFADGITDEITARLAAIRELSVISRQSAMQYKKREKNTRQIAEELGVDYILEGTVQREGSLDPNGLVRIRPQLINASDDVHMWAQIYEKNISEVFLVQSEVAKQVAQALDVTLLDQEKVELESIPTKNMEAWNYYLRGNDYLGREPPKLSLRIAIGMWEKAIELDPQFTLAHTQLSHAFILMYWNHGGSTENIEKAQKHIHTAVALAPDLPEVHSALGHYYYHGRRDYESAFKEFAIVLKSRPNDEKALSWTGWVYKRQGKFEKALEYLKRTYEIGPRNYVYPFHIGLIYELLDRYEQAEFFYDQAISLAPDSARIYNWKMRLYLRQGDTKKARAVQKEFSQYPNVTKDSEIMNTLVEIDVYERNYPAALDRLSSISSEAVTNWPDIYPNALRKAHIYEYMDKDDQAKQYYKEVRISLERKIAEEPNNINYQSILGIAYAGLGLREKAIIAGQKAWKEMPISKDAQAGSWAIQNLAIIYTMVGEYDKAIDQIVDLLSRPGPLSIPSLRLDPAWDPLRHHPRFKKLIEQGK